MGSETSDVGAVIAQTRFGWGVAPGGLELFRASPRRLLLAQLQRPYVPLPPDDAFDTSQGFLATYAVVLAYRRAGKSADKKRSGLEETRVLRRKVLKKVRAEEAAFFTDSIATDQGYVSRLLAFWADHFAISNRRNNLRAITAPYVREAIAPHVLGSFHDMLMAVVRHPGMLNYLDNYKSVGPNSPIGLQNKLGLNENFARELLELHTVGVDAGYTQADVVAFAKTLTGWMYRRPDDQGQSAEFRFALGRHEPGPQTIMGKHYAEEGEAQASRVLADLAMHPSTARHIALKLARFFVSDAPPDSLVEALSRNFMETGGDLRALATTLVENDQAWTVERGRFLPPQDFLIAVDRAFPNALKVETLQDWARQMGQPVWGPPSPEGFDDESGDWLGPEGLKLRLDIAKQVGSRQSGGNPAELFANLFGDAASRETMTMLSRAESPAQGVVLAIMSPEFLRR